MFRLYLSFLHFNHSLLEAFFPSASQPSHSCFLFHLCVISSWSHLLVFLFFHSMLALSDPWLLLPYLLCFSWINQLTSDFNNHLYVMTPSSPPELWNYKSGCFLDWTYPKQPMRILTTILLLAFCEWHHSSPKPDPWNPSETLSPTTQASNRSSSPQPWFNPWSSCSVSVAMVFQVDPQLSFITSPNYPVNGSQSNLSYTQHGDDSIVNKTWQGLLLPSFHKDENLDYTVWHTSLYSLALSTFPAEWSCSFPEQPKLLSGPGLSLTLLLRPLADSLPRTAFKGHCYTNPFLTFHIFYIIHIFLGIFLVPIQTDLSNIYSISHITCLCSFVRLLKQRPSWFDFCFSTT